VIGEKQPQAQSETSVRQKRNVKWRELNGGLLYYQEPVTLRDGITTEPPGTIVLSTNGIKKKIFVQEGRAFADIGKVCDPCATLLRVYFATPFSRESWLLTTEFASKAVSFLQNIPMALLKVRSSGAG
jgi:hypothetical protein